MDREPLARDALRTFLVVGVSSSALLMQAAAAAEHFGEALLILGTGMLIAGVAYHAKFMMRLHGKREKLRAEGIGPFD